MGSVERRLGRPSLLALVAVLLSVSFHLSSCAARVPTPTPAPATAAMLPTEPTAEPTTVPSSTSTAQPTRTPTAAPTATPTAPPTDTPVPLPTPTLTLKAPILVNPPNGASLNTRDFLFVFEPQPGSIADCANLEISDSQDFVVSSGGGGCMHGRVARPAPNDLIAGRTYYWRARFAIERPGEWVAGPWSEVWTFTITAP